MVTRRQPRVAMHGNSGRELAILFVGIFVVALALNFVGSLQGDEVKVQAAAARIKRADELVGEVLHWKKSTDGSGKQHEAAGVGLNARWWGSEHEARHKAEAADLPVGQASVVSARPSDTGRGVEMLPTAATNGKVMASASNGMANVEETVVGGRMPDCSEEMGVIHKCVNEGSSGCSAARYAECLSRHGIKASSYAHLVKARHGTFLVNLWDMYIGASILAYGEWSEAEVVLMRSRLKPDSTVIDVGANLGAITVPLAQAVPQGLVVSFEPQRVTNQILASNVQLNSLSNVLVRRAGAGDTPGTIEVKLLPTMGTLINIGALKLGINALDASQGKSERLYVDYDSVPIETIDSLGLERLDLIKVDAQGFEEKVLRGAREAIKRHLPDIYMEYETSSLDLYYALKAIVPAYKCYHHAPTLFVPNNFNRFGYNMFGVMRSFNVLCVARMTGAGAIPVPADLLQFDLDVYKLPELRSPGGQQDSSAAGGPKR